jgi:hypothetical protein
MGHTHGGRKIATAALVLRNGNTHNRAMQIEKFTDRAKGFLQAAQTVAIRLSHQRVTPDHLLKALLEDEQVWRGA